jgi:hypothetical protein
MPIRRRFLVRRDALTPHERADLTGYAHGAFASDEERRDAWFAHRDELLARAQRGFGSGPAAFWDYEGPKELRAPRHWNCVTPDPEMVQSFNWEFAARIQADHELAARRRAWLNKHLPWKAA